MKKFLSLIICLTAGIGISAQHSEQVKIACIGNSITYSAGIENRFQDSYPGILSQWLGVGYDVRNFGLNSRVLLKKGDYPYMHEPAYREVKAIAHSKRQTRRVHNPQLCS